MSITSVFISCILTIVCNTDITFANNSSFATISPDYHNIIVDMFLPSDYILPQNIYDWNVSEIVNYINQKDPELLYIIDTSYLVLLFPEYFLRQLPRDILTAHHLYYLLPSDDVLSDNTTNYRPKNISTDSSACLYPFVETKHDSYFKWEFEGLNVSFECGLLCEYGDVLYGIRPEEQATTDRFVYICCIAFFVLFVMVFINQCMDNGLDTDAEPCCHRGFMYHAPICISCIYAIFVTCLFLQFVVDKENIVCAEDIDDNLTVSLSNPGGSMVCTIIGSVFHTAMLLYGLYTFAFTFVLWRVFFAPLQSLWFTLRRYKICCPCVCCLDSCIIPVLQPIIDYVNTRSRVQKILQLTNQSSQSPRSRGASSSPRFGATPSVIVHKVTCHDIFCSNTTRAHYILYFIAFTITCFAISEDIIDAFSPLGLCTIGGKEDNQILRYTIIPFSVLFVGCTFFVPYAVYLLYRVAMHSADDKNKKMMQQLGFRILFYFIFMELVLVSICQTAWKFYGSREEIMAAAETRMFCLTYRASMGDVDPCYEGFSLGMGAYIQMALCMPLAGISSLILTCHIKNRKRWCILICVVYDVLRCKGYQHELALGKRLESKALEVRRKGMIPSSQNKSPSTSTPKAFEFPDFTSHQVTSSDIATKTSTLGMNVPDPQITLAPSVSSLQIAVGPSVSNLENEDQENKDSDDEVP